MVRKMGRPDYFITFTANPTWTEITDHLLPNQRAADRPDLVARVFNLKLRALLEDLTKTGVFGRAVAWTYVVEFQKRGLPHAHVLLIMHAEDKPRTPDDIDARVSAEIPPNVAEHQSDLLDIVRRCLLHGPCGARNPGAPCMQGRTECKAHYPKDFQEQTRMLADTYPLYRRRNNGIQLVKNACIMDNRDVVPYSPFLTKKFDAHINVEVVSSIRLVKYMYKYVYKGHDSANLDLTDANDEIRAHVDARYVGASEAVWRLLELPVHGSSHSTQRLSVHLPEMHMVTFREGGEVAAARDPRHRRTTLTAWFELNKSTQEAGVDENSILETRYHDLPNLCTWDRSTKSWKLRKTAKGSRIVGRLANVSPTEGERYYLFLLLLASAGATSFEDLRTVDGEIHSSFQAAAIVRGLCDSDDHYHAAMQEVLATHAAARARRFLATILACCDVAEPVKLWGAFSSELSEDFRLRYPEHIAVDLALQHIQECLERSAHTNADFGLPLPRNFDAAAYKVRDLRAEQDYDAPQEAAQALQMRRLMEDYPEQLQAYEQLTEAFDNRRAAVFFVDGPGGCGKSFLFEAFLHYVRGHGHMAVACA